MVHLAFTLHYPLPGLLQWGPLSRASQCEQPCQFETKLCCVIPAWSLDSWGKYTQNWTSPAVEGGEKIFIMGLHRDQRLNAQPPRFSFRGSWDISRSLALWHKRTGSVTGIFLKAFWGVVIFEVDFGGLTSKTLRVTFSYASLKRLLLI